MTRRSLRTKTHVKAPAGSEMISTDGPKTTPTPRALTPQIADAACCS